MTYEAETRKAMKTLGTYKPEFEPVIATYCRIRREMDALNEGFDIGQFERSTAAGRKTPELAALEQLRRDFISYAAQLGLTPHGLKKINDAAMAERKNESSLAAALAELE